jgi:hypothetical protein
VTLHHRPQLHVVTHQTSVMMLKINIRAIEDNRTQEPDSQSVGFGGTLELINSELNRAETKQNAIEADRYETAVPVTIVATPKSASTREQS